MLNPGTHIASVDAMNELWILPVVAWAVALCIIDCRTRTLPNVLTLGGAALAIMIRSSVSTGLFGRRIDWGTYRRPVSAPALLRQSRWWWRLENVDGGRRDSGLKIDSLRSLDHLVGRLGHECGDADVRPGRPGAASSLGVFRFQYTLRSCRWEGFPPGTR